jgi:gluconate 5-dehydrogenase
MSTQLFSLTGRTALVTGSSRSLGYAIATGLAQAGARVVLNGVDAVRVRESALRLRGQGFDVLESAFDVAKETGIVEAFNRLDDQGVNVDILVNNAGIQFRKPMIELETADWQRVIDTNLTSAFILGREAARRMLARRQAGTNNPAHSTGKIINIGSLMSGLARATVAPYTAAKGGIKLLTQSMTAEWAEYNIQTNAIGPGYMLTEMNKPLIDNPDFNAWVVGRTPARRWGKPEELVGAAVFLASGASNYVSGQIIYVDGGMSCVL